MDLRNHAKLILLSLLLLCFASFAQVKSNMKSTTGQLHITETKKDIMSNFPFQFGLNIGSSVFGQEYSKVQFEYDFFLNLSLRKKKFCLGLQLGKIFVKEDIDFSTLINLGFSYNLRFSNKHSLRMFGGLGVAGESLSYNLSLKYLYSFDNYSAVTFGIMYPVGKYNQVFQGGLSFFNFYNE